MAANIAQERIFAPITPADAGAAGLNVTLVGLPTVPGGAPFTPSAANFNNLAPAAGGDIASQLNNLAPAAGGEESDATVLNDIETAAGERATTSCWGDALNSAGNGQVTNLGFDGTAEDLLNAEARCSGSLNI